MGYGEGGCGVHEGETGTLRHSSYIDDEKKDSKTLPIPEKGVVVVVVLAAATTSTSSECVLCVCPPSGECVCQQQPATTTTQNNPRTAELF